MNQTTACWRTVAGSGPVRLAHTSGRSSYAIHLLAALLENIRAQEIPLW
jgi:hypothetical protein